jgi:hypothetical protein
MTDWEGAYDNERVPDRLQTLIDRWAAYLPMDCPVCNRHRLEYALNSDGNVIFVRCEKCYWTSEFDSEDIEKRHGDARTLLLGAIAPEALKELAEQHGAGVPSLWVQEMAEKAGLKLPQQLLDQL